MLCCMRALAPKYTKETTVQVSDLPHINMFILEIATEKSTMQTESWSSYNWNMTMIGSRVYKVTHEIA